MSRDREGHSMCLAPGGEGEYVGRFAKGVFCFIFVKGVGEGIVYVFSVRKGGNSVFVVSFCCMLL